jgi:hypothetical protein
MLPIETSEDVGKWTWGLYESMDEYNDDVRTTTQTYALSHYAIKYMLLTFLKSSIFYFETRFSMDLIITVIVRTHPEIRKYMFICSTAF